MTDREWDNVAIAFIAGAFLALVVFAIAMNISTSGDVVEVDGASYVGIKVESKTQWFEFDPTQPITFEKVATVGESK